MFLLRQITLAALATLLASCASKAPSAELLEQFAGAPPFATAQAAIPPLVSDFDSMRAALPSFDLVETDVNKTGREVSVGGALMFDRGSPIVSQSDIERIALLQAYLRRNPLVGVRIEGYDDDVPGTYVTDLALSRAQAVVRALLTDIALKNGISAMGAPVARPARGDGRAEIIFIASRRLDLLHLTESP
jgi:outer membrane protein OmpA-like peptidoglycan-associated protein